jgi:hypothetical protein
MSIYKKTERIGGQFAKKGEDIKQDDIITILNEGKPFQGKFGVQDIFLIRVPGGEERNITMNKTSLNNMIDAYGEDSASWVGKEAKVWFVMSNVKGKMTQVLYVAHPDATIDPTTGEFVIVEHLDKSKVGKKIRKEDIPIIEDDNEELIDQDDLHNL